MLIRWSRRQEGATSVTRNRISAIAEYFWLVSCGFYQGGETAIAVGRGGGYRSVTSGWQDSLAY